MYGNRNTYLVTAYGGLEASQLVCFKFIFSFLKHMCVCANDCSFHGGQERESDPMELKL